MIATVVLAASTGAIVAYTITGMAWLRRRWRKK